MQEYGSTEGGRFLAGKHATDYEHRYENVNRLNRSEGSLQINEQSRRDQHHFTKNPRYVRRFKGVKQNTNLVLRIDV